MIHLTTEEIKDLLKSGDFTIIYWDNADPTLYKGKWVKEKEYDRDEYETMNKSEIDIEMFYQNGYTPPIVDFLVDALGGNVDSI